MDEILEIEELRARNKILEEIYDICTDCRAGSMIAPPCEDMKKEIKQLKAFVEKAKQTNLEAGQELIKLSKENADLKSELETAKINYQNEVDLQNIYRQELDEIAHFIGIGLNPVTNETIMSRLKLLNEARKTSSILELHYTLTLDRIKEIAEKAYNTKLADKDCVNCDDSFAQILQEINKSKEKVESIYKRLSEQAFTKEELKDE